MTRRLPARTAATPRARRGAPKLPDDISRTERARSPTSFDPGTGRRLKNGVVIAAAALLLVFRRGAGGALLRRARRGKRRRSRLRRAAAGRCRRRAGGHRGQDLVLPGQTAAWYESIDLRAGQRLRRKMAGRYRRSREKGPDARDDRDPGARCGARRGPRAVEDIARRRSSRARPRPNSPRPRTSAGATRPRAWCPSRSARRRRPTTTAASARLYAANAQVALDQSQRRSIHRAHCSSSRSGRRSTAPSPSARSIIGNLVTAGSNSTHDAAVSDDAERSAARLRGRAAERGAGIDEAGRAGAGPCRRAPTRASSPEKSPAPRRRSIRRRAPCAWRWTCPTPMMPWCPACT